MKTRARKLRLPDRRGVTLVEMMVAVTAFAIVMAAVMGFVVEQRRSYDSTRARAQYQQGMRAVISMVAREIRSTGADPTGAGIVGLGVAAPQMFQCRMDLSGDGDVTDQDPDETVTYTYDAINGELIRNDGGPDLVVLRDLNGLTFRYYDENGAELVNTPLSATDRDRVRFIEINLVGEAHHEGEVDYTSRIALRNI